ncbi:MAG: hypothetical protein ACKO7X_07205, partial [Bacteroidota bacterium]
KVITIGFLYLIIQGGNANIRKKIIVNVKENSLPISTNIRLGATFLGTGLGLALNFDANIGGLGEES